MASTKTVAIIGAGSVGLAAAVHVLERHMVPTVLEAGPKPAHAIRQWRHVQLFSPWEYNIDRAAERLLIKAGWNSPNPQAYPTAGELIDRYLDPLATRTPLKDVIRTSSRVTRSRAWASIRQRRAAARLLRSRFDIRTEAVQR